MAPRCVCHIFNEKMLTFKKTEIIYYIGFYVIIRICYKTHPINKPITKGEQDAKKNHSVSNDLRHNLLQYSFFSSINGKSHRVCEII